IDQCASRYRRVSKGSEYLVISHCTRVDFDLESILEAKRWMSESLDWEFLIRAADRHGILPLVHQRLSTHLSDFVPQPAMENLAARSGRQVVSNLLMASEMRSILGLLASHNISAVPVKGPTLSIAAYDDIGLRQFGDIDIIIRKRDMPSAKALLISNGY